MSQRSAKENSAAPADTAMKIGDGEISEVHRPSVARRDLIEFDVGVRNTYTALAILARAREEGWGRQRPGILAPASTTTKRR